jgi:phosphatidylglycerophosphatase A
MRGSVSETASQERKQSEAHSRRGNPAGVVLGTFFGAGYFPLGPGTFASALTVLLVLALWPARLHPAWLIVAVVLLYAPAVWAAGQCEAHFGKRDPGQVVIDEVLGQMLALAAAPSLSTAAWKYPLLGFILFRLFDIAKPFPVRRSEKLPRGWGVVTDDCLAGLYAFAALKLAVLLG